MSQLRLGCWLLLSAWLVSWRRWRRGPLRPRWSWGYEVMVLAQKSFHARVARLTPAEERRAWAGLVARGPAQKRVVRRAVQLGGVPACWIEPVGVPAGRVILYLHGGGFLYGSERAYAELCADLSLACEASLLFVDYRFAPEHPFPAAYDDAVSVYRTLVASGVPVEQLVLMGDSAGGNLALAMLAQLQALQLPRPAAAVTLCPWVDLSASGGSLERNAAFDWGEPWMFERWRGHYLAGADAADPRASPARAELAGLPPLFIAVGSAEMIYDQVLAFAARARQAGVELTLDVGEDRCHVWHLLTPLFPEFGADIERIGSFVRQRSSQSVADG